jgi:creatinine amidohydrolase
MKYFKISQFIIFVLFITVTQSVYCKMQSDKLPTKYEELTSLEFKEAIIKSGSTCIIPFGILEKHGPHLPLGTDLFESREISLQAAEQEYTIVFPQYYFGQIFEAKHQPGTFSYSSKLIWDLLQETCNELSRNGIKKIIIVNGHGGNNNFIQFFCQAQLEKKRDYAVYLFAPSYDAETEEIINKMRKTSGGEHAGELESSQMLVIRPDLVKLDKAKDQSGIDQNRLDVLKDIYIGIWWYAKFPNQYAGDGSFANKELGTLLIRNDVLKLIDVIKEVKNDTKVMDLQNQFFYDSENPLRTEPK